ncbi:MAG TPA: NAD(P)/FAD-dependent oxidoreductase, partial [Candidatus Saccharimonadales bacterium]|nr:NAD(P)/FAD-dependent oxidoreductase [Candidatus Saccharimonadales bacterium]
RAGAVGYNYPSIKAWKDLAVRRTGANKSKSYYEAEGITVLTGMAHFISPHEISVNRRHVSSDHFLVATGSSTALPPIEGIDKVDILTEREAIDLTRPPKSLFIIGAGAVGCEFAHLFSVFGTKIHIADISPRLLPKEDTEVSRLLEDVFRHDRGVDILASTKVLKVAKDGVMKRVTYQQAGETKSVKVEEVLLASGRTPNTDLGLENAEVAYSPRGIAVNEHMQTSNRHIYAAGDVTGLYMFTHMSIYQGRVAAHNMLHRDKVATDYKAVPRVTFVEPEVASVGMSEEECIKRDLPIKKAIVPLTIITRANVNNIQDGFVKVMTNRDNILIGATVMGPHAGEVIHELTLAIQHGLSAQDVANTIHAFPTWSEAVRSACSKIN